jgi:hypothetical protein
MKTARATPIRIGRRSKRGCCRTDAGPFPADLALCNEHGAALEGADSGIAIQDEVAA